MLEMTNQKRNKKVSVIVPVYNRVKLLAFCLESLVAQDYSNYEIIVVDDASQDGSVEVAKKFPIKLVQLETNMGSAHARNIGAHIASGEYLAFIDSDCCATHDWISKMVRYLEQHSGCVGVNGTYKEDLSNTFISEFAFRINRFKETQSPKYINTCNTSSFMCRREDFIRVGGFPKFSTRLGNEVRGREDATLAYLLTKDGKKKIFMAHDVVVSHYFRPKWREFISQQFLYASRLGMHGICHAGWFSDISSFARKKTLFQILCLSFASLSTLIAFFMPSAVIFALAGLSVFILSYRKFLREYRGFYCRVKAVLALIATSLIWGIAGFYGVLKGFILVKKRC